MSQSAAGLNILSNDVTIGGSNIGAFGDLLTAVLTPVVQMDFVYGINSQIGLATTANSATVDTSLSRLRLQSGVNAAGNALFTSRRLAKYRAGEGMVARFTAAWETSAASSTQIVGVGTPIVSALADGYFFGFNGTSFGILHRNSGTGVMVDTWTAQASWNGDVCNGTGASGFNWDKTKGVPLQIVYPFLGYGNIRFMVQDPATSRWITVHTIKYANASGSIQLRNPNFYFLAQALNAGSTTNLTIYCGSVGVFISGVRSYLGNPKWAWDNSKTGITAETNVISLRNATTYNGITNRSLIRIAGISFSNSLGTNPLIVLMLKIGATLGGSPAFTPINGSTADNGVTITAGNSITSYDTAGTTVTGGTYIWNSSFTAGSAASNNMDASEIFIAPGETLTISVKASIAANVSVSVNWTEDI